MLHHVWPLTVYLGRLIRHKYWVFRECARFGLYWQGAVHDLDKWWPPTLLAFYVNYYCRHYRLELREHPGYERWLQAKKRHHQGRRHHAQHWVRQGHEGERILEMPHRYATEMACEWIAINRTPQAALDWYRNHCRLPLHADTRRYLEQLLTQWGG